jgi:ABC-type lipopolysaccharide export system ATPase subunit
MTHTHVVGLGPTGTGETTVRQFYIVFGLIPLNEVDTQRFATELTSYAVDTRFAFVDLLLAPLLLPLTATSRTVTVRT